ncbi:hypothetical protein QBC39DRAFT_437568 [Podospora conica]|nr:hypothetical protein QBC39DRAFT_437568 [Schizothecium conicum]
MGGGGPLVCLGSRGDHDWALFWSRWWCRLDRPLALPVCFHTVLVVPDISLRGGRHGPESRNQSGLGIAADGGRDEQTQPSPVGCEATTCRGRVSRGGGGRVVGDDDGDGAYGAVSIWQIMDVACRKDEGRWMWMDLGLSFVLSSVIVVVDSSPAHPPHARRPALAMDSRHPRSPEVFARLSLHGAATEVRERRRLEARDEKDPVSRPDLPETGRRWHSGSLRARKGEVPRGWCSRMACCQRPATIPSLVDVPSCDAVPHLSLPLASRRSMEEQRA